MINVPKFNDKVLTPTYMEDADDFYKFLSAFAAIASNDEMLGQVLVSGLKFLMHDYMALVLAGKLEPFEMESHPLAEDAFREAMLTLSEVLVDAGAPMKEVDGKMIIDRDEYPKWKEERG